MSEIIGRHPAFAQRGGFCPSKNKRVDLYAGLRAVKEAANAVLERRGQLPHNWRDGATVRRPVSKP